MKSTGEVRVRPHGKFFDVVVNGRKVGHSFTNREHARFTAGLCKDALRPVTT